MTSDRGCRGQHATTAAHRATASGCASETRSSSAAATFPSSCSIVRLPGMTALMLGCCRHQAIAQRASGTAAGTAVACRRATFRSLRRPASGRADAPIVRPRDHSAGPVATAKVAVGQRLADQSTRLNARGGRKHVVLSGAVEGVVRDLDHPGAQRGRTPHSLAVAGIPRCRTLPARTWSWQCCSTSASGPAGTARAYGRRPVLAYRLATAPLVWPAARDLAADSSRICR
jgi:hypothetical protein